MEADRTSNIEQNFRPGRRGLLDEGHPCDNKSLLMQTAAHKHSARQLSPHRIVLIEDNPADTVLLRHALDEVGEAYVLEVLEDGEAALYYVRAHCRENRSEPCLIILDLHLPHCDGTTVLRAIRSEPELAHVSVVVLTASVSPAEREEVLQLGVQAYRAKPMDFNDTLELAREFVRICKQQPLALQQRA